MMQPRRPILRQPRNSRPNSGHCDTCGHQNPRSFGVIVCEHCGTDFETSRHPEDKMADFGEKTLSGNPKLIVLLGLVIVLVVLAVSIL